MFKWMQKPVKDNDKGYTKESHDGFYNTTAWQHLRRWWIINHPLCQSCEKKGRYIKAVVVDHIKPVDVYPDLKLNPSNLQSLCDRCHRQKTRKDNSRSSEHNKQRCRINMKRFEQ